MYRGEPFDTESRILEIGTFSLAVVLLALELWDIGVFVYAAINRQLNLEALTVNAPLPPLLFPLPGGVIMDEHRRNRRDQSLSAKVTSQFSLKRVLTNSSLHRGAASSWMKCICPLWLTKLHHLGTAALHGLFSDYIFHQPTIILVWG